MVPAGCLAVAVGHACVEILSAEYRAIDRILYCLIPLVPGGQVIDRSTAWKNLRAVLAEGPHLRYLFRCTHTNVGYLTIQSCSACFVNMHVVANICKLSHQTDVN